MKQSRSKVWVLLPLLLLWSGCHGITVNKQLDVVKPSPTASAQPLQYAGIGAGSFSLGPWEGAAVLHITTAQSIQPFRLMLKDVLEQSVLVEQTTPLDEYRALTFSSSEFIKVELQGDAAWNITLLPPTKEHFPVLHVPGAFWGSGSAVILLEGEHSIAIFNARDLGLVSAWAYMPGGENEKLVFKATGDYRGRAVLPESAAWILVVAQENWSVEVQVPCCEAPPG